MRKYFLALTALVFSVMLFSAAAAGELAETTTLEIADDGTPHVRVALTVPPDHYVYAEKTSVKGVSGTRLEPVAVPSSKEKYDAVFEKTVSIYDHSVEFVYRVVSASNGVASVEVGYQGCTGDICFFPQRETHTFTVALDAGNSPAAAPVAPAVSSTTNTVTAHSWEALITAFDVRDTAAGYLPSDAFIEFLDQAESGVVEKESKLARVLAKHGIVLALLLTLLLGLGLNLTPCVLPMIPINIAIIGAGAQSGSRARGFALGGVYGLGIAFVYGLLGVIVVYTHSKFGELNASPWFNLTIGVVFVVLSLAMFDKLQIDFSRFGSSKGGQRKPGAGFAAAAIMGCISALLAGACVAPALISVLVLAADLYSKGNVAGLLLPFVLGLGMALPWPFAGAGLSFLPKPGRWMERVKQFFGVIMVGFAAYYFWIGVTLLIPNSGVGHGAKDGWHSTLASALQDASAEGKPVFVDFWASWCKSCHEMDVSTFADPEVVAHLDGYVKAYIQAEDLSDPGTEKMLDHFGALGLPTYVVLVPKPSEN